MDTSFMEEQIDQLQREREALRDQIDDERLLADDEKLALRTQVRSLQGRGRFSRAFTIATLAYLSINALSMRTPGPAHWLGFDTHVRLFSHLGL